MEVVLKKQLSRFLIAGVSAVGTDLVVYYSLLNFFPHTPAKAVSFLSGTVVAYLVNKYWTFEKHQRSYREMIKFLALYVCTLGANVGMNKLSLTVLPGFVFAAFLAATATSTILNFIGQKFWVFK